MLRIRYATLLIMVALHWVVSNADDAKSTKVPQQPIAGFFQQHCLRCHGPKKENGQLRLDELSFLIASNDQAQRWQDVLDVLNGGEMPPADQPQPKNEDLAQVLESLTNAIVLARKRLTDHGGEISMRRLNRREYTSTIRDLFGFDISLDMVPEDNEADSFDTVGAEQFFSSSHFDKYLELGRELVARGFEVSGKPHQEVSTNQSQPEDRVTERLREKLADLDNKMRMKHEGKTWKEMGFKDEGEMQIVFSQFKNRAGKPRQYLQYPHVNNGVYLAEVNNESRRVAINRGGRGVDPRGTYRLRIRAGINGDPPEIRKFARVSNNDGTIGVVKINGTPTDPQTVEIAYKAKVGQRVLNFHVEENRADIRVLDAYLKRLDPQGEWASIWIDSLAIEGPFYDSPISFFGTLIHPDGYVRGKTPKIRTDTSARELIRRFAFEAFRRQEPDPKFVDQLVALFEQNRAAGQKYETAMGEVLAVVLASPNFLFLHETTGLDGKQRQLDDRGLAIRLAYFLWSSPPDNELYACAANGTISQPDVLHTQVDRMLNDPKSEAFFDGFMSQWAELDRFNAITVDQNGFFRFNKGIRHSAYREVIEFFKTIVAENLPASTLIDSEFVVINSVLAEHYGLDGGDADGFQKVSLPANSPRGGLLGQTAFLTLGSNGERSSPVIRGALVMEKLLHDKPAPPPPNVPELGAATKKPATNRQMVELHQSQAVCASCHKKMDMIGFGLENFDPIGKWRDTEKVGRKQVPIEPGGTLPSGAKFSDVVELKTLLKTQQDQLAEELVESLLAYGLGRTIEFSDTDKVTEILSKLRPDNYSVRSMIHDITQSQLFRTK